MELELIEEIQPEAWDEAISHFDSRLFYHRSGWLSFLEETESAKPLRFRIVGNGKVEGYFVALLVKKGFFRILGSPLSRWDTEYIGPIVNKGFDTEKFLNALEHMCRQLGIHQLEIGNPVLHPESMQKAGFAISQWNTFIIPLSSNENEMWKNLTSKGRNRIRKGIKSGLIVQDCNDPAFVDKHYNQLIEVYAKQNLVPPNPIEFFHSLFRNLKPQNLLFTLQVKHGHEIIATGVFPHDDRFVFSLSTASWRKSQNLCPNELLHWTVMSLSGKVGIQQYNIGGIYRTPASGGRFKDKFNGSEVRVYRYTKSYSILAKFGREIYKTMYHAKQKVKGRFPQMR